MKRRGFFSALLAVSAVPVVAVAKSMTPDPIQRNEKGEIEINQDVRINGAVVIQGPTDGRYALSVNVKRA